MRGLLPLEKKHEMIFNIQLLRQRHETSQVQGHPSSLFISFSRRSQRFHYLHMCTLFLFHLTTLLNHLLHLIIYFIITKIKIRKETKENCS